MEHDNESTQMPPPAPSTVLPAHVLDKAPTYIPGLDEVLEGGLPRSRTTVINGEAGSGKTLMGLEFLYRGALAGEPGIFVGFEEPMEHVRQNAATLGWNLAALEREDRLFLFAGHLRPDTVVSGDFSLKGLLAAISGKSRDMGAKRVVIDALEVVLRLFDTPQQVRNEMHTLNNWLQESGLTVVLTIRPTGRSLPSLEGFFQSLGDCVIFLEVRMEAQISIRRLRVVKYRGSSFGRNEYPYVITSNGLNTAPVSTVGLRHKPLGEKIPTGNDRLDEMLGGGYHRAACILLAGEMGTGKTLLATTCVREVCGRGEKVLYIGFEESEDAVIVNVSNAGINLKPHLDAGRLQFLTNFPEAMGAEEHYIRARARIDTLAPSHVVVDAISACERMGGKQAAFEYLMRLLNACKEMGITILLVNQISGAACRMEISGNGISSMVDTVVSLTYQEEPGETNRLIQVIKSRGAAHSNQKHEYSITDDGIRITDVYVDGGKILTGATRQRQEALDRVEVQRLAYDIETQELELKRLRLIQEQVAGDINRLANIHGETASGKRLHQDMEVPDEAES